MYMKASWLSLPVARVDLAVMCRGMTPVTAMLYYRPSLRLKRKRGRHNCSNLIAADKRDVSRGSYW